MLITRKITITAEAAPCRIIMRLQKKRFCRMRKQTMRMVKAIHADKSKLDDSCENKMRIKFGVNVLIVPVLIQTPLVYRAENLRNCAVTQYESRKDSDYEYECVGKVEGPQVPFFQGSEWHTKQFPDVVVARAVEKRHVRLDVILHPWR